MARPTTGTVDAAHEAGILIGKQIGYTDCLMDTAPRLPEWMGEAKQAAMLESFREEAQRKAWAKYPPASAPKSAGEPAAEPSDVG